jgi:hypothetical protein
MQKTQINPNQLNLLTPTTHGYEPYKSVKFHGKYIKTEKHQKHFRGQAAIMLRDYCNGEFWTTKEWIKNTDFVGADRILRHISNGKFKGYGREEIKVSELHSKYRIVRLDK